MQVHVDDVKTHIAGTHLAEDGIQIGAIVVQQTTCLVDEGGNFLDLALEHTQRGRVGQHNAGGLRSNSLSQRLHIDIALAVGGDLAHLVSTHDGGCRIGSMGRIRHQDLVTPGIAIGLMIGPDHGHTGELTLRPGCGGQ